MQKPRIIHLSSAHKDRDDRIFYKQCISLAEEGFDVHLVLVDVEERLEGNVTVHSVPKSSGSRIKRMWKSVNDVYKKGLELNGDLYHIHDPELLRIAKKLKRKGKKVVYDAHEDLPRQILSKPYLKFRKQVSRFSEWYENRIVKKIDGIITATPFIRDRFIKINKNSIDINNFPIFKELYSELVERKPTNKFCYVGGISQVRGISELMESLNHCKGTLVLAGNFDSQELENEIKQHPNWPKVSYEGFLSRQEIKNLYNNVSIGMVTLHPRINFITSLPVKMFEYMITGLPVICSDFDYWKEIIEKNECGLCVDPMDPQKIGKAVQYLIDNPEIASKMGMNGRKLVLEKYNWDIEKKKLFGFYDMILRSAD